ncbi:MAG: helix-turn-helix transcriptional regulator [Candidatus Helarchaeota archaeon]|nr:helix-turn-helix transcriptional regulator [Candidatus Helarchaeota archaeon]
MMFPSGYNLKSPIELLILLTIKKEKEIHGFDLIKKLNQFKYWEPKAGTIYPILERLSNKGILEKMEVSEGKVRKKSLYSLTKEGEEILENNNEVFEISFDFFEKVFEIGNEIILDDLKFIEFLNNRIKKYLGFIQKKKFEPSPESISELDKLTALLNSEIKNIDKKISDLKKEGKFVKIKIE